MPEGWGKNDVTYHMGAYGGMLSWQARQITLEAIRALILALLWGCGTVVLRPDADREPVEGNSRDT